MGLGGGSGASPTFTYKIVIFAIAVLVLMPIFTATFLNPIQSEDIEYREEIDTLMSDYQKFTGRAVPNSTSVWVLTGIYTPFNNNQYYGWTEDGWLYGSRIASYTPSQYDAGSQTELVSYSSNKYYTYNSATVDGHSAGDLYTSVSMSLDEQSNIFFSDAGKTSTDKGFYYEYTGYRYAFSPLAPYTTVDADGNKIPVVPNTTSLSLIWYNYYAGSSVGDSGIAGQLVVSSNDGGTSYITSQRLIQAYNSHTNTATFPMVFNKGVKVDLVIRIDPLKTAQGMSVQQCYEQGYWSVMVTSQSVDTSTYTSTDYSFNIYNIWDTFVHLFTFNLSDYYDVDNSVSFTMSLIMSITMYAGLLAIGLSCYPVLVFAGILAVIQAIQTLFENGLSFGLW